MIAEDVMTRQPVSVTERATIGEALGMLSEANVRHLPVVRGGEVVGILSDRDFGNLGLSIVNDEYSYDRLRAQLTQPVSTLMTGGVVTVGRDSDLAEVIELMVEEKLSAVPVVETGTQELSGILSYVDVLRAVQPLLSEER